jgi:hypothetical protein
MTASAGTMTVKVTVADTWQQVMLEATPDQTAAGLKLRALAAAHITADRAERYEVKFGGAKVRDESRTIGSLGVTDGSALIVLTRRRRAVR